MDLTALGLLAAARRQGLGAGPPTLGLLRPIALGICGVSLALGLLTAAGSVAFGSPAAALAYLRGERLSVEPSLVDIGEGSLGEEKEAIVQVRNWAEQPVRVVGGTSDCSCVATRDLPVNLQPGEARALRFYLTMKGAPGQFTRLARLYVKDERLQVIHFRITGKLQAFSDSGYCPHNSLLHELF